MLIYIIKRTYKKYVIFMGKLQDKFHWTDSELKIRKKLKEERIKFFNRINNAAKKFHDEIRAEAHAFEAMREEVFVHKMGDILEEYGEIEALVSCPYRGHGMKVDGYCFDNEFKDFILLISLYLDESDTSSARVSNTDINREMKRVSNFFKKSLEGVYKNIEVSNEAFDLSSLIYECRS